MQDIRMVRYILLEVGCVTDFQVLQVNRLFAITYSADYAFSRIYSRLPISEFPLVEITDSVFLSRDRSIFVSFCSYAKIGRKFDYRFQGRRELARAPGLYSPSGPH